MQVQQPGAGGGDQLAELFVGGLLPGIDPLQVADQLGCQSASGFAGHVTWSHTCEEGFGLGRGQVLLRPAGNQLQQQGVQLGDLPSVLLAELAAAVGQHAQDVEIGIGQGMRPRHSGAGQGDGVGVGGVCLASLPVA